MTIHHCNLHALKPKLDFPHDIDLRIYPAKGLDAHLCCPEFIIMWTICTEPSQWVQASVPSSDAGLCQEGHLENLCQVKHMDHQE